MSARVEFYEDKQGEHRWRAWAENNRVVADSAEGYENKDDCIDGAKIAMMVLTNAVVVGMDS